MNYLDVFAVVFVVEPEERNEKNNTLLLRQRRRGWDGSYALHAENRAALMLSMSAHSHPRYTELASGVVMIPRICCGTFSWDAAKRIMKTENQSWINQTKTCYRALFILSCFPVDIYGIMGKSRKAEEEIRTCFLNNSG